MLSKPNEPAAATTFANLLFISSILAIVIALYAAIRFAGFSFPVPWPDEAHFFWQAYSFGEHSSLFSSVLNSERTIMWMPPGYFVTLGILFKIFGSTFEVARLFSTIATLAFFLLLVQFLSAYGYRWFALVISGLFLFNGYFIAMGNVARMEAAMVALVVTAFLCIQHGRFLVGLLLLALTPLLHFNGFYFALSGLLFVWYSKGDAPRLKQISGLTLGLFSLVLAAWVGYAIFAAMNWDGFLHDMQYQFARKGKRDILGVLLKPDPLWFLGLSALAWGYVHWSKLKAREILFLAAPAWICWIVGLEMWYEVFRSLGYLCMTLLAVHCWFYLVSRKTFNRWPLLLFPATALFLFFLIRSDVRSDQVENIFVFPEKVHLGAQYLHAGTPYMTSQDSAAVSEILVELANETPITVYFDSTADALFFTDLVKHGVEFVAPVFENREIDLMVVHLSNRFPGWWKFGDRALERAGLTRDSTRYMLYSRDSTDQWYFVALSERMKSSGTYWRLVGPDEEVAK